MSPLDLVRSKDGSMSITKVAAAAAHLSAAVMFWHLQWGQPFNEVLWLLYLGFATGHAFADKSAAMLKSYKERQP